MSLILRGAQRVLRLFGGDLPFKCSLFAEPNTLTLGETFYTAAPLQYGKYVGQAQCLAVVGFGDGVRRARRWAVATTRTPTRWSTSSRTTPPSTLVSAQLCIDTTTMPIENATTDWSTDKSPYQPVAKDATYPDVRTRTAKHGECTGDDVWELNSWRCDRGPPASGLDQPPRRRTSTSASSEFRHEKNGEEKEPNPECPPTYPTEATALKPLLSQAD